LFILACAPLHAFATEKGWQAGVARVNITPELPIWLSGYGARSKPATTKHDDLWAKALVIEDAAGHRAVLVTMDLVGIDRELSQTVCQRLAETHKLPRSAIALATSHTHSGPVVDGNLMPMFALDADQTRRVKAYKATLINNITDVVSDAISSLAPANLSYTNGTATFAVNRRNNPEARVPELRKAGALKGPVDHDLPVLVVTGGDGKEKAIVAGYACHATVLSDYFISADWPGAAQTEIERRHPGVTALYVLGCGGDQNPLPRRKLEHVENYGKQLADGVDDALKSKLTPLAPELATAYAEIDLPLGKLPTRMELERAVANDEKPQASWARFMLAQWDRDGQLPASYPYPIQAWKVGDQLTWLFLGGEVVVDYSLRFKAELGRGNTWVASYANDVMGYIPSRRVLLEGRYEGGEARYPYGLPAPWSAECEELIVSKVRELTRSKTP
jgi:hypothetical protein